MNRTDAVFHCGLAVFVVAGVLGGNWFLLSRFDSPSSRNPVTVNESRALGGAWIPADADPVSDKFLPLSTEAAVASQSQPAQVPQTLAASPDARPLQPAHAEAAAATDALIEHAMSDAPSDEREIWNRQLRDLPPAIVHDILHVRKQQQATRKD